jgi:transcription antitermination factor NusG
MLQWIAVYTKPRQEKVVLKNLVERDYQVYLPLIRQKRKWSDRYKWIEVPLFKSYIFVKIDIRENLAILQTNGVHHIVKFKNQIATIPDNQIESLRQMIDGGFEPDPTEYFIVGDSVEVGSGPLLGINGVVTRIDGIDRLIIKIDAIQHAVSVRIDRKYLKPYPKK